MVAKIYTSCDQKQYVCDANSFKCTGEGKNLPSISVSGENVTISAGTKSITIKKSDFEKAKEIFIPSATEFNKARYLFTHGKNDFQRSFNKEKGDICVSVDASSKYMTEIVLKDYYFVLRKLIKKDKKFHTLIKRVEERIPIGVRGTILKAVCFMLWLSMFEGKLDAKQYKYYEDNLDKSEAYADFVSKIAGLKADANALKIHEAILKRIKFLDEMEQVITRLLKDKVDTAGIKKLVAGIREKPFEKALSAFRGIVLRLWRRKLSGISEIKVMKIDPSNPEKYWDKFVAVVYQRLGSKVPSNVSPSEIDKMVATLASIKVPSGSATNNKAYNILMEKVLNDTVLTRLEWNQFDKDTHDLYEEDAWKGIKDFVKFVVSAGGKYKVDPPVLHQIQAWNSRNLKSGDVTISKDLLDRVPVTPFPKDTLSLLSLYPNILYKGLYGCSTFHRFDFNKDNSCDSRGEGRADYNADGVINEADDWILLAANRDRLGGHSKKIKQAAKEYWSEQKKVGNPKAATHLAYWTGKRKLEISKKNANFNYATQWVDYSTKRTIPSKDFEVRFNPREKLASLSLRLFIDGKLVTAGDWKAVPKNERKTFRWPKNTDADEVKYTMRWVGIQKKGKKDILSFGRYNSKAWSPVVVKDIKFDLIRGTVKFHHNQRIPLRKITFRFFPNWKGKKRKGEKELLAKVSYDLKGDEAKGPNVTLNLKDLEGIKSQAREARITFHDPHNVGYTETHWRSVVPITIEHDEVHFSSGSWKPYKNELRKKVEPAIHRMTQMLRSYPKQPFKLWIVGKTDRVASEEFNIKLSWNRARVIADYFHSAIGSERFRQHMGRDIEIYFVGVGESMAKTRDGVSSKKNRRVDYILSENPPFEAKWTKTGSGGN